jgi:hypothetical protein
MTPKTIKKGPKNADCIETIQAVAVLPIFVPNNNKRLSRKVRIPVLTKETVREDTSVLDWITEVRTPPNINPPKGTAVTLPIHLESFSLPKPSISLLKLCSPYTNRAMDAIITTRVSNLSIENRGYK